MKATRTGFRWILSTYAVLLSTGAIADIPSAANECVSGLVETTPSSDFTALEGGAVARHEPTGLEWRRCAEGMSWTGAGCTGSAFRLTWQEALQHTDAASEWRLPNISELRSIVERCRTTTAINEQVFPNTSSASGTASFWSSTPASGFTDTTWNVTNTAWYVRFNFVPSGSAGGGSGATGKGNEMPFRLVRGGH